MSINQIDERQIRQGTSPKMRLDKGVALVLHGPHGSGKMQIAEGLASKGTWAIIEGKDFSSKFALGEALVLEPKTLVVDGMRFTPENIGKIKTLLSDNTVAVERKHKSSVVVNSPKHVIICTADENALNLCQGDRRFRLVNTTR